MNATLSLDPTISALCDEAAVWLVQVRMCAMALGKTAPQGIDALRPRLYTGYMPEAARRNLRHRTYCDGLRPPTDRTGRAMREMGLVR